MVGFKLSFDRTASFPFTLRYDGGRARIDDDTIDSSVWLVEESIKCLK
jgi:hypothetical protein